jgi:hypothetical protein
MFFLLRLAFWVGLVLVLIPTGKATTETDGPQIGALDAWSAVSATVSDLRQFCTRQEQACAVGGQVIGFIGHRAQDGAKALYAYMTERKASDEGKAAPVEAVPSQSTLTAEDRALDWRGPPLRREARAKLASE